MIGRQLHQVALAKTAEGHDLVREGKVIPTAPTKAKRIVSRILLDALKTKFRDLTRIDLDKKIK